MSDAQSNAAPQGSADSVARSDSPAGAAPHDWPEDFSHENGRYFCKCCQCGKEFFGHKRRVVCKLCAAPDAGDCKLCQGSKVVGPGLPCLCAMPYPSERDADTIAALRRGLADEKAMRAKNIWCADQFEKEARKLRQQVADLKADLRGMEKSRDFEQQRAEAAKRERDDLRLIAEEQTNSAIAANMRCVHAELENVALRKELENIINCDMRKMREDFGNGAEEQFRLWAQNRARYAMQGKEHIQTENLLPAPKE